MNAFDAALEALRTGRLVVVPTDTVYGVAAVPSDPAAVRKLFDVKGRPHEKGLPVLGRALSDLRDVAVFDERAERLASALWPGPLTLVLPRAAGFDHDLGGPGDGSIAVRVPAATLTRELLGRSGPLAVTSANSSGTPSANTVEQARAALGDAVAVYLDGGPGGGRESTVVSLLGEPQVLREGALSAGEIIGRLES